MSISVTKSLDELEAPQVNLEEPEMRNGSVIKAQMNQRKRSFILLVVGVVLVVAAFVYLAKTSGGSAKDGGASKKELPGKEDLGELEDIDKKIGGIGDAKLVKILEVPPRTGVPDIITEREFAAKDRSLLERLFVEKLTAKSILIAFGVLVAISTITVVCAFLLKNYSSDQLSFISTL